MNVSRRSLSGLALLTIAACLATWLLVPTFSTYLGVPSPAALKAGIAPIIYRVDSVLPGHLHTSDAGGDSGTRDGYIQLARQDAEDAGIPPDLFVRQINRESGFNPRCGDPGYSGCISRVGAVGIAQFLPATARGLGIDPWNPTDALRGAAQLMSRYLKTYGDYRMALAAYNGGTGTLQAAITACGPAWLSCEPAETRHYVQVIDP